ncbi:MAG: phosphoribosylglycinamide synthetase C domain-containing protein, partial [Beijerinckiaceae bacterium]
GRLRSAPVKLKEQSALTVVYAAHGYPVAPERGTEINGLDVLKGEEGVLVFHAGTKAEGERLLANGGRVLNVTGLGSSFTQARKRAYAAIEKIDWPGGFYRRDIGWRAIERLKGESET